MNGEILRNYGQATLRGAASLLMFAHTAIPQNVEAATVIEDNGVFPQCMEVKYQPRENLNREPLIDYPEPFHPQIKHAIDTLYANGLYDLLEIQLLPADSEIKFRSTPTDLGCLPDLSYGHSRRSVQTGEGSGHGIPQGGVSSNGEQGTITVTSEGVNPILVRRLGERYPGSEKVAMDWLFWNLQQDQRLTIANSDGSYTINAFGPFALPISRENPGGEVSRIVLAEIVFPKTEVTSVLVTRINLTSPEGSVTPRANGFLDVSVTSRSKYEQVEFLVNGRLEGFVPERKYQTWGCLETKFDCGTDGNFVITTDVNGAAYFNNLRFWMFDRSTNPVASFQVRELTSGAVPTDSCPPGFIPCATAPFAIVR